MARHITRTRFYRCVACAASAMVVVSLAVFVAARHLAI